MFRAIHDVFHYMKYLWGSCRISVVLAEGWPRIQSVTALRCCFLFFSNTDQGGDSSCTLLFISHHAISIRALRVMIVQASEGTNRPVLPRFSGQTGSVSRSFVAAEETDGSWVWASLRESHDGGPEATGFGSESGGGWGRWFPVPADPGTQTAWGGAAGPEEHPGMKRHRHIQKH